MSNPSHLNNNGLFFHMSFCCEFNFIGYFPSGWSNVDKKKFQGWCFYTANANGNNALCNIPTNTNSWRPPNTSYSYVCAKIKGELESMNYLDMSSAKCLWCLYTLWNRDKIWSYTWCAKRSAIKKLWFSSCYINCEWWSIQWCDDQRVFWSWGWYETLIWFLVCTILIVCRLETSLWASKLL